MLDFDKKRLGWTDTCCICARRTDCYDNPDPLREGENGNCCPACNRLVIAARRKLGTMAYSERAAYTQMLRDLPLESLEKLLFPS